jgi:hypothetical protein
MLNRLKEQSDDKGFVLKEISEIKWGSAIRGTAPKEMSISKKIERYEREGDDNNANGDEGIEKAVDLPRDRGKESDMV